MCYTVFLSTTSEEDFGPCAETDLSFDRMLEADLGEVFAKLEYPYKWWLLRFGGCSCHFRHIGPGYLGSERIEPYFSSPEDWFPEDEDDIVATGVIYDLLRRLVDEGHKVDLVDVWTDTKAEEIRTLGVSLAETPRESFRFFEGYRFVLAP